MLGSLKFGREIAALQAEAVEIRSNWRKLREAFGESSPAAVSYWRVIGELRCREICAKISRLRGGVAAAFGGAPVEGASRAALMGGDWR